MKCTYKIIIPMMICVVSLNAMHDDAEEWLNAAQRAYEKTEGVQHVKEEKHDVHEAQESFEKLEQAESSKIAREEYDEADFDENDYATWFSECPKKGRPLTCDYFKGKRYFQRAASLPREKKNDLIADLKDYMHGREKYSKNRCKTAGWVCAGADPNTRPKTRPFLYTIEDPVRHNDYWLLKILLEHKLHPNVWEGPYNTPLYLAKKKEIAELLVAHGAKTNWTDSSHGITLLHVAAWAEKSSDLLEYYIQQNIPINVIDIVDYHTALHRLSLWCGSHSHEELVKKAHLLFKAGIDIDAKAQHGQTAQDMLRECQEDKRLSESSKETCKLLYDLIEEERNHRLKQMQKNGGDHGIHV
jgi:hypothetical protein